YLIRVNRFDSRERQRFTIAHELAHYLLHREIIDSSPNGIRDNVLYRSGEPRAVEYEANKLAAEIVMPRKLIDQRLREFNETVTDEVIERLAEEFQVSKAAMEVRLG
ncbi:MAG: ImmA/IrrE family metallo-endopeptidase, partial [Albidovulum sp.]|nr:ImmA/IrrE family metallo-endopeptidase [Albidovulum sp.]